MVFFLDNVGIGLRFAKITIYLFFTQSSIMLFTMNKPILHEYKNEDLFM